jgi:hypothetical protein
MNFRALGIVALIFTTEVLAQQWGPEIRVTNHPGNSYRPDIACDSKGNVYVVWEDDRDGNFEIHYAKLDSNGTVLVPDTRLTNSAPSSRYPKITVDSRDRVYIVWREDSDRKQNGDYGLSCAIFNKNFRPILTEFIKIEGTGNSVSSLTPNITLDHTDNLHIVWDQSYTYTTPTDTIYNANEVCYTRIRPDGKVQIPKLILTKKGGHMREPVIALDHNSNLHLTWATGAPSDVDPRIVYWVLEYAKFDSAGQQLLLPTRITPNIGHSRYQALLVDDNGVHCVFSGLRNGIGEVFYQKLDSTGRVVITETNVSRSARHAWNPKMKTGANQTFHVVWDEDRYGTTDEIYYARIYQDGYLQIPRTRVDKGPSQTEDAAVCVNHSGRVFIIWADYRYMSWDIMLRYLEPNLTSVQDYRRPSNPSSDHSNDIHAYPSPTGGNTMIQYKIGERTHVDISIYDGLGRLVRIFPTQEQFPGQVKLAWDTIDQKGQPVPSGIYICRVMVNGIQKKYELSTKILVLR